MPRILLTTLEYPPDKGGISRYLDALVKYFTGEIEVWSDRQKLLSRYGWPKWLPALFALIKNKDQFDTLVVSHLLPLGTVAWLSKFITKRPYVVIVHGMDVSLAKKNGWKKWLSTRVLRSAKVVVVNSQTLADEVQNDFKVKTLVVYPTVDKSKLSFESKLSFGVDKCFRLLTVSRLVPRKGHLRVLEALSRLREYGQLIEFKYRIIGDGPMKPFIEQRIDELDLNDMVSLETSVSDEELETAYQESDLFVMPTVVDSVDREGFGIVYLEAAAYGVPSIGTDQPGVDEAIIDRETGFLVPDKDIDALANAIWRLSQDNEMRNRLGQSAKKRVLTEFTAEKQFSKLRSYL